MKRLVCVVATVSMMLAGCGGSVCEDVKDAFDSLGDKVGSCDVEVDQSEAPSVEQCEEALDGCSESDKENLGKFADCISDIPDCEAGEEDDFLGAAFACAIASGGISEQCQALGAESLRRAEAGYSIAR